MPLVSISDAQRDPLPDLNWQATIYHGLPMDQIRASTDDGSYLAFLGRTSPEKGLDQAIAIARRSRLPLKIAAKVDPVDEEYFEREIRPLLTGEIEFVGEIAEEEKDEFLGRRLGAALPHRLAGAVRPGDDRGRRARDAGARLSARIGARGDRRGRHRHGGR